MKIGLQNFQGIAAYTEIPIAPITLFYGPNSAGKSTVADAIEFLSEALKGDSLDRHEGKGDKWQVELTRHARRNRKTRPIGEGKYIGEPDDVVFTASGQFTVSALVDLETDPDAYIAQHKELIEELYPFIHSDGLNEYYISHSGEITVGVVPGKCSDGLEFEYQLFFASDINDEWFLRKSLLSLKGTPFFQYSLSPSKRVRFAFNTQHPLWDVLNKQIDGGFRSAFDGSMKVDSYSDPDEIITGSWQYVEIDKYNIIIHPFDRIPIYREGGGNFTVINSDGSESSPLKDDMSGPESPLSTAIHLLNLFFKLPQQSIRGVFNVAPIRPIPEKDTVFEIVNNKHQRGCWETLAREVHCIELGAKPKTADDLAITFINSMLTSSDFLDTGYSICGTVKFNFSLDIDELSNLIQLDTKSRQKRLEEAHAGVHLYLVYQPEDFRVEISDVGVGVSQVVPVLFGCWMAMNKPNRGNIIPPINVHIQQPELHLHPKLQAQMADVFIKCANASKESGIFLLESHSEHLLLRLLRRIRETNHTEKSTKDVLSLGKARSHALNADQVSVVYVKKDKNGLTTMKPLRLADDGEFIDRWPDGFFTDRDIELFGEEGPFA